MAESTMKKVQNAISDMNEEQLDMMLNYAEELMRKDLINQRAQVSEEDIKYERLVPLDQFNQDFQEWKKDKRRNLK